ncbi:MAG TPA: glycosyltransferase family 4 protein [Rhodospirillales bacterium]|nr:glycosyltransferase family 4 protein [Rhodospirillales bacterium]
MHVLLPGPPETPTGGFVYDRQMLRALRRCGRLDSLIILPGGWPEPGAATVAAAERALAALPAGATLLIDGLAFSPLLEVIEAARGRPAVFVLVHHPLADETGLAADTRARLFERECRALALAQGVIVTSATTARRLADFAVPGERIRVVRPAVDAARCGGGRRGYGAPRLLCVATLTPRKGQDVLLRALAGLRRRSWRLRLVGPERDRAFAGRLRRLAGALRLSDRIDFAGAVTPAGLPAVYRAADLFVFPSHHEGFGIVVAEAAAYGLPIVASDAGAIAEAAAGSRHRLVPPGDAGALARAIRPHLNGRRPAERRRIAPWRTWQQAGAEFLAALDALGAG